MRRTLSLGLLAVLGLLSAVVAEAREVEITIPVRIATLHPTITVGRVQCVALNAGGTMVASASHTDFSLVNGSYSGDVTVRLNLTPSALRNAARWRCELRFVRPYEASAHALSLEGGDFFHEEFRLVAGSERRFHVEGDL